jgi:uncharacterized protein (TIGR03086 family)
VIDLAPAAEPLAALVTAVDDDRLADPTPCAGWAVADLLDHLAVVAAGFTALARGADDPGPGAGPWDPERRKDLARDLEAMVVAWDDPAAWEGTAGPPGLELPRPTWGRIGLTELVVHAWDLARTLGRPDPDLPRETLQACLDHVAVFVPQAPLPDLWGDPVTPRADAGLLDRIVAVTGRTP